MQGHAAANIVPLVASNRVGAEQGKRSEITFYGTSFIADHTGAVLADAGRADEGVITASFDLDAVARYRETWGVFRDRRPERYGRLQSIDGSAS
jgi:N-carbamoylputrescine amidase